VIDKTTDIFKQLLKTYGKNFSSYDHSFFSKCIEKRMNQLSLSDTSSYLDILINSSEEFMLLERDLNNHFSTFFRNPLHFFALEHYFLPNLIAEKEQSSHHQIRIWSMACAYGQEAYSIAIIMDELLRKRNSKVDYRIFCTDHMPHCIEKAKKAQYSKDDVHFIHLSRLERYFNLEANSYTIKASLKEKLIFSCYDLLDPLSKAPADCIYNDFDLIFCCNVLYYYSPSFQERIIAKITQNLTKTGILITDDSEKDLVARYTGWTLNQLTLPFFQKTTKEIG
jgi:chemotaxis protein methyltransferase CheR